VSGGVFGEKKGIFAENLHICEKSSTFAEKLGKRDTRNQYMKL